MPRTKIAITLAEESVEYLDDLVKGKAYRSRSHAIQEAIDERIERLKRSRLARELEMLDPDEEQALAEEGIGEDPSEWPGY